MGCYSSNKSTIKYSIEQAYKSCHPCILVFFLLLFLNIFLRYKIERGDRRAKRCQVIQMATYFKVDEKEMLTLWLADKVLDALEGEDELKLTAIETAKDELMDINR